MVRAKFLDAMTFRKHTRKSSVYVKNGSKVHFIVRNMFIIAALTLASHCKAVADGC